MAGTWKMFNSAKKLLGTGTIILPGSFRMALFQSTSNLRTAGSAKPLQVKGSVTNEVANGSGYLTSGITMLAELWSAIANASTLRFSFTTSGVKWSANGGTISGIKYAMIFASNATAGLRYNLAYVTLTTTGQISLADTNTLTIKPSATGIFQLGGM